MTDIVLPPVTSANNISTLNNNFAKLQDSINKDVLQASGGNNIMHQDIDMNGNDLINLNTNPSNPKSILTVGTADSRYINVNDPVVTIFDLPSWALNQTFQLASAVRDSNGAIVSANIVWPDGKTGVFVTDIASVDFPGAIDAWHATYESTPSKLITQPAVTRDVNGAVVAQPAISII